MPTQMPSRAASVVLVLLSAFATPGWGELENPDLRGKLRPIRAPRTEDPSRQKSPATVVSPRTLGPAPRLAPISRFVTPIEPWVQSGLGWGDPALGDDGEPLCETNRVPESQCDPLGPRSFLHVGFDAQPAPDRSVRASAVGWVVAAQRSVAAFTGRRSAEAGGVVVLRHDMDGDPATEDDVLLTVYEHIEPVVSAGDIVQQGDIVARTSVIGGEHLHFGVMRAAFHPDDPNVYHTLLPPPGTTGCLPCFSRPTFLPAFPEHWEDPERLFRTFEWARVFAVGDGAAGDVLETPGGYLAAGWTTTANIGGTGSSDMWILRLDPEGRILSQRAYGGPGGEQVRRLVATADGGFAALALSESFGPKEHAPLLLKFNAGEERPQWQTMYVASSQDRADDLKQTSDGGFVIVGATDPCASYGGCVRATVVKVDSVGVVQWARSFRSLSTDPFATSTAATSIVQTADGGYTVAGEVRKRPAGLPEVLVFRLDASGNLVWASSYGGARVDATGQIEATGDGGFVIVGQTLGLGLWLLKILDDGNVDWEAAYVDQTVKAGNRIILTSDGGYVVAGHTLQVDSSGFPVDLARNLWILKLDSTGQILRQQAFDGRGSSDTTVGLRATRDGGFVLSGSGDSFLVVKTNTDLEVSSGCGTNTNGFRYLRESSALPHPLQQEDLIVTASPTDVVIVPTEARNHACEDGYYGPPPTFESVSVEFFENHAVCDLTVMLEADLCTEGIPGLTATSPVIIDATYDALALTAHVTDPDSTADRNDVFEVNAGLRPEGTSLEFEYPVELVDDGSSTVVHFGQRGGAPQDCFYDRTSGVCACRYATYPTYSGDALPGDARYTQETTALSPGSPSIAVDCALATRSRMPVYLSEGTPYDIFLRATDRQGNISAWPEPFRVTTGVNSYSCSGDTCGCCLLNSRAPNQAPENGGCFELEGMSGNFHVCQGFPCLGECRAVGGPDSTYQSGFCKEIRNPSCSCFEPCRIGHPSCFLDCPYICPECFS